MYWLYITNVNFSWKDRIFIDYFKSQSNIELSVRYINVEQEMIDLSSTKPIDRIILSNLFEKSDDDYYYIFLPLYISNLCQQRDIHFTYLNQEYENDCDSDHHIRELLKLSHPKSLYLNFWMLMHEDISIWENMLHQFISYSHKFSVSHQYYLSVIHDILPILFSIIFCSKSGVYEMANPTPISYQQILDLYEEYLSVHIDTIHESLDVSYSSHNEIDTSRLEQEYFILPSYQSLQRLLKRIRKGNVIVNTVNLQQPKTSILVTGGYGFIGSNLIHHLYHKFPKCLIINIDRLDYCSRRENLDDLLQSDRLICYDIDLCDTNKLQDILITHSVQYIFHLAAQSHVDNSFNNSLQFSQDNVYGTHSLLEASKNYGKLIRFLHVSTDEIYGETLQINPFDENVLPNPTNPYAATKVGAEYIVKSYYHCFELPIIIVRGNNVYGPRQFPEKMIPKFITNLLTDNKCTIAGNGLMMRNFVYVEDVCAGLVMVIEKGKIDEIYNIGSDDEKTVLSIAQLLISKLKKDDDDFHSHIRFIKDRYYNDFRYSINSNKIRKLGWKPKISFTDGLDKTIQFYTENIELYNKLETVE